MQLKTKRFTEITKALLKKDNCAIRCKFGYIQDLHLYVKTDMKIVGRCKQPSKDFQCQELKKKLLYILENFETIKKGIPNVMIE